MDDQTRLELARAERAKLILEDPLVVAALQDITDSVMKQWRESPKRDAEGREYLFQYFTIIEKFKANLAQHMEAGKIAAHAIKAEEEQKTLMQKVRERIYG